jgi:hypothetical protein
MCRLLGLTAGREPISASFWLLDAPDSLEVQSRRNADGSGIGFFDPPGTPALDKPDLTVESAVVLPDPPAHLVPLPTGPNIDT